MALVCYNPTIMAREKEIFIKYSLWALAVGVLAFGIRGLPSETRRDATDGIRDFAVSSANALAIDGIDIGISEPLKLPAGLVSWPANALLDVADFYFNDIDARINGNGKQNAPENTTPPKNNKSVPSQPAETPAAISKDGLNKIADSSGVMPQIWLNAADVAAKRAATVLNGKTKAKIDAALLAATITGVKETETNNALIGAQFGKIQKDGSYYGLLYGASGPALTNGENKTGAGGTCQFLSGTYNSLVSEMLTKGYTKQELAFGTDGRMDYRVCAKAMAFFFATKTVNEGGVIKPLVVGQVSRSTFSNGFTRFSQTEWGTARTVWNAHQQQSLTAQDLAAKYMEK